MYTCEQLLPPPSACFIDLRTLSEPMFKRKRCIDSRFSCNATDQGHVLDTLDQAPVFGNSYF